MNDRTPLQDLLDRSVIVAAIVAVILTAVIMFFKVLTHFPFFDETIHVRYLWQFSIGLRPGSDFFCVYPALGYLVLLPLMDMFPESAFVFLGLRSFSLILAALIGGIFYYHSRRVSRDWIVGLIPFLLIIKSPAIGSYFSEFSIDHLAALAAISAIAIYFTTPRLWSIAAAAALAVLSIMITPKYPLPLFFGMAGFLAAYYLLHRTIGNAIAAASGGALAALTGIILIFAITGTSLADNIRHSFLVQYRWSSMNAGFGLQGDMTLLFRAVLEFFVRNWVSGTAILLGIAGCAMRSLREGGASWTPGAGILAGAVLSSFLIKDYAAQYVAPIVLCLTFFAPFACFLVKHPAFPRALRLALVTGALIALAGRIEVVAQRFDETPWNARGISPTQERRVGKVYMAPTGIIMLADYSDLLEVIPQSERVVAAWPYHPIFRRDQTVIGFDERPSYYSSLEPDDQLRNMFDPAYFRMSLERHPPALIVVDRMEYNYPPGWKEEAQEFLSDHKDMYVLLHTGSSRYPVRKDLVPD